MAAAGRLEEGFDIFVNDSCSRLRRDYAHDLERFVDSFACWQPADSTARKFNGAAIESFLSKVEQEEEFIAAVIGFNEFPHTHGRTLVGSNREIVREYWFEVDTGDARIAGQDGFVILHVHFAGKWHELRDQRDRSTISQINIRHTARREEDAWKKCVDLDKWREQYGEFVVRRFPGGWKWKERPEVSPAFHKILSIAEKCTILVRGKKPTENVPTGKHRALIIANSNYNDTRSFGNLPNAFKDGQQLNDVLRRMKWDVSFKVDLGFTEMREKIENFVEERDAAVCMFAFIGHGIEVNGSHYLVAQDARLQQLHANANRFEKKVQKSCIDVDFVQECFGDRRRGTHPTLFVLDCCRSCDYQTPSSQSVSDGFLPSASITKPPAPKTILRNSCVIMSTSAGHVAEDGDPGAGGPFMSVFVKEMEAGGDVVDIVRRTQTAMETAGAEQQTVLEQSSGQSCHFPPLSIPAYGQSATLSSSMAAAPASVQFPPSAFQPPLLPGSNTPMEGLVAATATSGDALRGIKHTLDTPPVSPFPFVFVAGSMNAGLARHARSVAEGWEAYGVEYGPVVTLQGNWYGDGGCGRQISLWKPSILHIDARADPESSSMNFKDGAVPYEKLHSTLKYISEDGVRAQLLVLMVSHSADGGHGESLSRFADRILAVRGEASFASRNHLETVYQELRRGKTLRQALTYLDFTTHEHNLVLLPSQVQEADLVRFTKCPKERDALDNMCQGLQGVSLSKSFYSEADTASASETESDEEGPLSTRKAVFLHNTGGSHSYAQDVLQLFGSVLHGEEGQQPQLSICGLLLCFAVDNPEQSGFEHGAHPECWEEWLDRYKQAARTGKVIEAEMLDSFEEASSRSGATPGIKRHSRCIETIDALVQKAVEVDWDMLMEVWKNSVLQDWFTNDESSEAFLARANRHLMGLVIDGRLEDGICGVRVLQALEMSSYGAFMIMDSLAVDVLLVLLDLEFRAARASAKDGVSRPASGFVTVVCSDRRVFSFRDGKLTTAHARSVIVSGLRCLVKRTDEDLGQMWQLPTARRPLVQIALNAECVAASSSKMSAHSMPDTDMKGQDNGETQPTAAGAFKGLGRSDQGEINPFEDEGDETALQLAPAKGKAEEVKVQLEADADKEAKGKYSDTELCHAAMRGQTEAMKVLLEAGADTKDKDDRGNTALRHAAEQRHTGAMKVLLEAGADPEAKDEVLSCIAASKSAALASHFFKGDHGMNFGMGGSSSQTPPRSGPRTCGIGCNINIHDGGGLIVRKVIAGGPAAFSCELAVGDILLKVDGVTVTHETPDEVARRIVGPEDVPITVTLRMRRTLRGEPQWREDTVTLLRQPTIPFSERLSEANVGLGIDIARVDGGGLQVRRLQSGAAAQLSGKLKVGDVILEIDGNDVRSMSSNVDVGPLLVGPPFSRVCLVVVSDRQQREIYMVRSIVLMGEFHMRHTAYRNQMKHAIVQPAAPGQGAAFCK